MTKVYVIDAGRKFYYHQWTDPETGKRITRSSRCTTRRDAERAAMVLETQLSSGRLQDGKMPWADFCDRYQMLHLASLARKSEVKAAGVLDSYTAIMTPATVANVSTASLSTYAARLRSDGSGRSEATIAGHLRVLRAALAWAKSQGIIHAVPPMPKIQRAAGARVAKGRPITAAEFVQMLRATRGAVGRSAGKSWRHLLRGLWLSGLRLGEACALRWDHGNHPSVELIQDGGWLVIPAAFDKSHIDRRMPLPPDFAAWLARSKNRSGFVFSPRGLRGERVEFFRASQVVSKIGKAAGVITDPSTGRTATAHDFRRAFAQRWASRLTPIDLQRLMRHASIATTLGYYLDADAAGLAERMKAASTPTQQSTQHSS